MQSDSETHEGKKKRSCSYPNSPSYKRGRGRRIYFDQNNGQQKTRAIRQDHVILIIDACILATPEDREKLLIE